MIYETALTRLRAGNSNNEIRVPQSSSFISSSSSSDQIHRNTEFHTAITSIVVYFVSEDNCIRSEVAHEKSVPTTIAINLDP